MLSAGPDRLEAAGAAGVPQVVSLGALDMVNFGPRETVPPQFAGRILYVHNPTVTLMRTTPEECAELGSSIGRKLHRRRGADGLFVPLEGRLADRHAGPGLPRSRGGRGAVRRPARDLGRGVELHELEPDINDPVVRGGDGRPARTS